MYKFFNLVAFVLWILEQTVATLQLDNHVIAGSDANIENYPWMGSVRTYGNHACGGTLIRDNGGDANTVLTAGHCIQGFTLDAISVALGSASRAQGTVYEATQLTMHSGYDPGESFSHRFKDDIALIRLNGTVDPAVALPATLAPYGTDYTDEDCVVTGWGRTSSSSSLLPLGLKKATLRVIMSLTCEDRFANEGVADIILTSQLCTQDSNNQAGVCDSDDGGPLHSATNDVIGIVSWWYAAPFDECSTAFPNVYTRVSDYRDWIAANT